MSDKPRIVTICGSSRYVDIMAVMGWLLEKEGVIVHNLHLLPWWYETDCADHVAEHEGVSSDMDILHFKKIDISDEVFVVNWGGYIGDSTRNEIDYAKATGKKIRYITEEAKYLSRIIGMLENAKNKG